jgi:hypothetical protein
MAILLFIWSVVVFMGTLAVQAINIFILSEFNYPPVIRRVFDWIVLVGFISAGLLFMASQLIDPL